MNRSDLKAIIEDEGLIDAVFLDETSITEDAVVLEPSGSDWMVYLTVDRAFVVETTFRRFSTEADALDYMLVKLRQSALARRLLDELD